MRLVFAVLLLGLACCFYEGECRVWADWPRPGEELL